MDQKKEKLLTGWRGKAFLGIILAALGALVMRLFFIQLIWGGQLGAMALATRTATEEVPAVRGNIYDRNHNLLVGNEPAGSVYADPRVIQNPAAEAAALAPGLGVGRAQLQSELTGRDYFVWLAHDVPFAEITQLKKLNLKGVYFLPGQRRVYPQQGLAAQVLGFTGRGEKGLVGLEKSYNAQLTGRPGWLQVQVGADGRPILQTLQRLRQPTEGDSLVLTIDENIQFFVEQTLNQIMQKYKPADATIIVMDPKTGGILAMGSRPTFNPADWQKVPESAWGQDPAVLDAIEPGSVFKIVTTAAALEEGVAIPQSRYTFPGYITVQGRRISDWNDAPDKDHTLAWAFANSYNPVFSQLALNLGATRFYRYIHGFGFGQPTGIDLPGESDGIVIPEKTATPLNLAEMAIGQSISVTPLQMLTAACAVADGGYLLRPHLVKAVVDASGKTVKQIKPYVVHQVISAATAHELISMMRLVTEKGGTAPDAAIPGYSVAGKTGTAQVPGANGYQPGKFVSSFLGFAPASNPAIGILIVVKEPKGNQYYGGEVTGPYFSKLGAKILHYLDVPYDLPLAAKPAHTATPVAAKTLPNLAGYPVIYARPLLYHLGLNVSVRGREPLVARQQPAPGSAPRAGTTVILDTGPAPGKGQAVTVPNLSGLSIKLAGDILDDLGLRLQALGSGLAAGQTPAAGAQVTAGTTVRVQFNGTQAF